MPVVALIDTNVWVSAFIKPHGPPARLKNAWLAGEFEVVTSLPLLDELVEVLTRPRIQRKYQIDPTEISDLLKLVAARATLVVPSGQIQLCRDPDDDIVLETAILGKANYAVSRDDDLKRDLILMQHLEANGVSVVSVQQFLIRIAQGKS